MSGTDHELVVTSREKSATPGRVHGMHKGVTRVLLPCLVIVLVNDAAEVR